MVACRVVITHTATHEDKLTHWILYSTDDES